MQNLQVSLGLDAPVERRLELRPDEAVSIPSTQGTVVRCLRGPLWLTQEGQWRDYILVEGSEFVSASNGKIVLSALDGACQALVLAADHRAACRLASGLHITSEAIERARQAARRAQAEEFGRLLRKLASATATAGKSLLRRILGLAGLLSNRVHHPGRENMSATVLHSISDGIATLTLNRPEKLNALNYAMIDALLRQLDAFEADEAVRVIIITGAGDRAFCAGGDIPEFSESVRRGPEAALREFVRRGQRLTARIESYPKPVIAVVNGIAYGGGCEITEAAHLAIASDMALLAKPEIKLGMPPTFGGTQRLPRLAGRKRALGMLLTGDAISSQRALEIGLVNQVVPHRELMAAARSLAARVMRHSPLATASILAAVTRGLNATIDEGLWVESEQFARMVPTRDIRVALDAWIGRRAPDPVEANH